MEETLMEEKVETIKVQQGMTDHPTQNEEDQELADQLELKFIDAKNAKSDIETDLEEAQLEYENNLETSVDGMANIKNPILFAVIQNKIAEEISTAPDIRFLPKKDEDVLRVDNVKAAYYDSTTRGRFNYNIFKCFMSKDVLGTGIAREEYSMKRRTVRDMLMTKKGEWMRDKNGKIKTKDRVIYDEDDLVLRYVDIRRFYPDPEASDMEEAGYTFELEEVAFDDFMMYASHDAIYKKENLDLIRAEQSFNYNHPFGVPYKNGEEKKI